MNFSIRIKVLYPVFLSLFCILNLFSMQTNVFINTFKEIISFKEKSDIAKFLNNYYSKTTKSTEIALKKIDQNFLNLKDYNLINTLSSNLLNLSIQIYNQTSTVNFMSLFTNSKQSVAAAIQTRWRIVSNKLDSFRNNITCLAYKFSSNQMDEQIGVSSEQFKEPWEKPYHL